MFYFIYAVWSFLVGWGTVVKDFIAFLKLGLTCNGESGDENLAS